MGLQFHRYIGIPMKGIFWGALPSNHRGTNSNHPLKNTSVKQKYELKDFYLNKQQYSKNNVEK